MLFVDAKCCCFNSVVVYKQMSKVDLVEASLGWSFHAGLKLLLVLSKYIACLIISYLKGFCSVLTVRVCHRCFASPKLLHPVFFYRINRQRVQPPSSTPVKSHGQSSSHFQLHSSPANAAPHFCAFDPFAFKLNSDTLSARRETSARSERKFSLGC